MAGRGVGCNRNEVVPPGGARLVPSTARRRAFLRRRAWSSLGVDAAADDPESPLLITAGGFGEAGRRLRALDLPTVLVQEGGYHLPTLGPLVLSVLAAWLV